MTSMCQYWSNVVDAHFEGISAMSIVILSVFLFKSIFAVSRKWLGFRWCRKVQPTPAIVVHFQSWANHVTTAHRVNTHGYHNHMCSGASSGSVKTYNARFYTNMQLRRLFPPHSWCNWFDTVEAVRILKKTDIPNFEDNQFHRWL